MSTILFALAAGLSSPAHAHSDHHGHSHHSSHSTHSSHARPASSGVVLVDNRSGRSLDLYVDGRFVETVRSGKSSVRLSLGQHVLALKAGDRTIESRSVNVRSGSTASLRVDKPDAGIVVLTNHEHYDVVVYVDGKQRTRIEAHGSTTIHIHGEARIDLVDERGSDRMLTSRMVNVDCFDVVGISWGSAVASASTSSGHVRPR
ncbi:MAG: hypothetical protein GY913_18625 [Proteobacteria bacterium]|nr:hypothetical protein [Pseudomonadota bacterium]MCP4918926.1 hypothetical protein [Pseudomonadota bacterium]